MCRHASNERRISLPQSNPWALSACLIHKYVSLTPHVLRASCYTVTGVVRVSTGPYRVVVANSGWH
jgi:hypothetical protein